MVCCPFTQVFPSVTWLCQSWAHQPTSPSLAFCLLCSVGQWVWPLQDISQNDLIPAPASGWYWLETEKKEEGRSQEISAAFFSCPRVTSWSQFVQISPGIRRRQRHATPVLLPGKSHGWRSLVGCSPWGCWGSDTTERLHFHFSLSHIGEGNGNPLQCSCLENSRDGGAWWAVVYGVAQSRTRLKWLSSSSSSWFQCWKSSVSVNPAFLGNPGWLVPPSLLQAVSLFCGSSSC